MITRLVKMTFHAENCAAFEEIFMNSKARIKAREGCRYVELLRDERNPNVYFTRSIWDSEEHLNMYRDSELFKGVWAATKALFSDKPQAWSTVVLASENEHGI